MTGREARWLSVCQVVWKVFVSGDWCAIRGMGDLVIGAFEACRRWENVARWDREEGNIGQLREEVEAVGGAVAGLGYGGTGTTRTGNSREGMHAENELPRGVMGGIVMAIVGAATQSQEGESDWIWARWPRGFGVTGRTPDCAVMVPWGHWWWRSGDRVGHTRIETVAVEERPVVQNRLFWSYEAARVSQEGRAPNGLGFMFDGLVVAGWLCWHEMRPILAGVEPVSREVAAWVYQVEARSMVGPRRGSSGPRRAEDGTLERVFPSTLVPREAFGQGGAMPQRAGGEENRGSRTGDSPASSRRSRADREV